jgi:hypothetical protein
MAQANALATAFIHPLDKQSLLASKRELHVRIMPATRAGIRERAHEQKA